MSIVTERSQRLELLLADEAVQQALADIREANYQMFRVADSDEGRRMAQARAQVLDTFEAALRATVDGGKREILEQERADRHLPTR